MFPTWSCLEGKLQIQTSCRPGERWVLLGYFCLRYTTWVVLWWSNQVMRPVTVTDVSKKETFYQFDELMYMDSWNSSLAGKDIFMECDHHHHHVALPARISLIPLSPPVSIVHRSWQVFKAIPCVGTELLYVGSSWSSCLCSSMWRGPQEYITYGFVLTSPAVSHIFGSSNLDSFRDEW